MKLSTKTRYGMRVMIELATFYGKGPVHLSQIARSQELSDKYLEQIVSSLKVKGLVSAIRGSKGGYLLSKEPREITAQEIVECLEGPLTIVDCIGEDNCSREENCSSRKLWHLLSKNIKNFLNEITLEDLRLWQNESNNNFEYTI